MILIKRIIIAVFLLFLVVYNGQAQVSGKHKIVALSEADTGNSKFFHQNKQIQNIAFFSVLCWCFSGGRQKV